MLIVSLCSNPHHTQCILNRSQPHLCAKLFLLYGSSCFPICVQNSKSFAIRSGEEEKHLVGKGITTRGQFTTPERQVIIPGQVTTPRGKGYSNRIMSIWDTVSQSCQIQSYFGLIQLNFDQICIFFGKCSVFGENTVAVGLNWKNTVCILGKNSFI